MNKQHSFSTAGYQGNLSESVDQNVKLDLLQQQKMTGICTIQSSSKHYHHNTKTQFFLHTECPACHPTTVSKHWRSLSILLAIFQVNLG